MDLFNVTKKISEQAGIFPSRSKGQNFLIAEDIYDKIVDFAQVDSNDTVLEVGPGLGFLTEKLSKKAGRVIAVELDNRIYGYLVDKFKGVKNIELINEDVLKFSTVIARPEAVAIPRQKRGATGLPRRFAPRNDSRGLDYKIVANLPYNISSRFLRVFLENEAIRPQMMVLMLQKEVAERIAAKPGKMSLLALSVQLFAEPKIVMEVFKKNFWPEPQVDSAVIKITSKKDLPNLDYQKFFQMLKFAFSAKRKKLKNNLSAGYQHDTDVIEALLNVSQIPINARAQELSLDDWYKLFGNIEKNVL